MSWTLTSYRAPWYQTDMTYRQSSLFEVPQPAATIAPDLGLRLTRSMPYPYHVGMDEKAYVSVREFPKYVVNKSGVIMRGGKEVASFRGKNGYPRVNMIDGKRRKQVSVHRLVAEAFIGEPAGRIVRHLDGNPSNCDVSNLAYGSYRDNENDKRIHGRAMLGERHHQAVLTEGAVKNVVIMRKLGASPYSLAAWFGVSYYTVYEICNGRAWRHLWVR